MIRPFTLISMALFVGSGLYLYQSKHQAQVLDREIAKTIKQTGATRDRIAMLQTEWGVLNETDRLAELASAHTALQSMKPAQFVAIADLAAHLPPPGLLPGQQGEPEPEDAAPAVAEATSPVAHPAQVASAAPNPHASSATQEVKAEAKPVVVAAEPKPSPTHRVARTEPTPADATAEITHVAMRAPSQRRIVSVGTSAEATAPGTVGAAVLRAMRARQDGAQRAAYVEPVAMAARTYAPQSNAPQPYAPRPYAPRPYAPASTYQPTYAAPSTGSVLGGSRGSLPPPVPYAAR